MEYCAMLDSIMHYDADQQRAAREWGHKNPHWILLAQAVAIAVAFWFFVWVPFFSEPTYTDYELQNLPYQEDEPEQCYGLGGSYPC